MVFLFLKVAVEDVRPVIWAKLFNNAAMSSVSALTRQDVNYITEVNTKLLDFCYAIIKEVEAVRRAFPLSQAFQ